MTTPALGAKSPRSDVGQRRLKAFSPERGATRRYNRAVHELKWDDAGLITAVVQDRLTGQVRMVAWMNREALTATLETRFATFYSRSRRTLWRKGETTGHVLRVHEVAVDCDGDTLLLLVDPEGPSCHTGHATCFFRRLDAGSTSEMLATSAATSTTAVPADGAGEAAEDGGMADPFLLSLEAELEKRSRSTAERSYTRSLLDAGVPKISAKISEEAAELNAALAGETDARVANEAADVLYHMMVGLRARGIALRRVIEVLAARAGQSGHAEKANRTR
jgi:phosphoribosyl-ATP pyrophosphohydrolase/phosphoribosyl-AMP cyclohydrolase